MNQKPSNIFVIHVLSAALTISNLIFYGVAWFMLQDESNIPQESLGESEVTAFLTMAGVLLAVSIPMHGMLFKMFSR